MLVKDEADIIGWNLDWLLTQVDFVYAQDNASTDGTREILGRRSASNDRIQVVDDFETGYWQSIKTTDLAQEAYANGHDWVVPVDADEFWYATDQRTIKQYLEGMAPDVMMVEAELFNHIPSASDDKTEPNPFERICWRQREKGALPKVACRTRPDLVIEAGNHSARVAGQALKAGGLCVRHFSWRTRDQYLRKIRNGQRAYAATDLPWSTGEHWRMWAEHPDEAIRDHFTRWFYTEQPEQDPTLIYDPAPYRIEYPRKRVAKHGQESS